MSSDYPNRRVGIVGCGFVSSMYMHTQAEYSSLSIIGAFDIDSNRLRQFSEHYNVPQFETYEALVEACDIILNLTTPESHFELSKYALEKGVSVYTEKPITPSDKENRELISIALKNNANLFGAPCIHLSPMAESVKHYLEQGLLGDVYAVYAEMDNDPVHKKAYENWSNTFGVKWPAKNEFESGATLEHAGYTLCLLQKWFGTATVLSIANNECIPDKILPVHKNTADFSCAVLKFPNSVVGRVTCSIVAPIDHSVRIFGSKGVLTVKDIWQFNSPLYWQNYFTLRSKTRINPIKRRLKIIPDDFPAGRDSDAMQMDFMRGVHELSLENSSNKEKMENLADVNQIVIDMNGTSVETTQYPWLIIGTGVMSQRFCDCLKTNAYPISGVVSATPNRAQQFAEGNKLEHYYESLSEIPVADNKQVAYVASLNTEHAEQVRILLEKGYDVLSEKPLTMSFSESENLYRLAAEKNLILQENLWSLFVPAATAILEASKNCKIAELEFSSPIPYKETTRQWLPGQGGCIHDLGIYPLAWSVYLFGEIQGFTVVDVTIEHDVVSEFTANLEFNDDRQVSIKAGFHNDDKNIKLDNEYFFPIFAPEYRSKFSDSRLRKVHRKLRPPAFPVKDRYAHVINAMNSTSDEFQTPYPANSSLQIAKVMDELHAECRKPR